MKKLLLLLVGIILTSCTAEPLPNDIDITKNNSKVIKYLIKWDSNQIEPYMDIFIQRKGIVSKYENIKSKAYNIDVEPGDLLMIGINYKATALRPEVSLSINRYMSIDYTSGVYNPDDTYNIFEEKTTANGIGFNGKVDEKGNVKYN